MSKRKATDLTPNEWKIMQIVWELKSCAARDVYEIAGRQFGWAPTTVKTYLSLLVEKGSLSAKRVGNSFLYKPKTGVLQSLRKSADGLMGKILGDHHGPLLAYMIRKSQFSAEDIEALKLELNEAEARLNQEGSQKS